jgi:hypothetical protein
VWEVNLKRNHNCAGANNIYLFHLIVDRAVTQARVINDLTSVYPSRIFNCNILQTDLSQVIPLFASNIRALEKEPASKQLDIIEDEISGALTTSSLA